MSREKQTPRQHPPAPSRAEPVETRENPAKEPPHDSTGAVKFDERGNAVWQWSVETGSFGANASSERMRRLENAKLRLADDQPTPFDGIKPNPLGTKKGYDPYDSGRLGKHSQPPRKKDLRKLSEWLKLKKQASSNKDED